jgi:hypothetical protein
MNESRPNGFPGQQPEQAPQSRVPNSPERDRRGQAEEPAQRGSESTRVQQQLARARRLDYRKQFQRRLPERIGPIEDPLIYEAEMIVLSKDYKEMKEQELVHLTPQQREDYHVLEEMDNLKESRTMIMKINYAKHLKSDSLTVHLISW